MANRDGTAFDVCEGEGVGRGQGGAIEVQFEPRDGAGIDLNSLQIKYKMFNLTKKVTERMQVTNSGISGEIDGIGPGKYKLKLSISDDRDRTAKADLSFEVVVGS